MLNHQWRKKPAVQIMMHSSILLQGAKRYSFLEFSFGARKKLLFANVWMAANKQQQHIAQRQQQQPSISFPFFFATSLGSNVCNWIYYAWDWFEKYPQVWVLYPIFLFYLSPCASIPPCLYLTRREKTIVYTRFSKERKWEKSQIPSRLRHPSSR